MKEQEKKEADDKAIQEARASVIARRKQKSERDAVAASLSSLPQKEVVKPPVISVSASAPNAFQSSKYVTESSSDESQEVGNKSKSVIGVSGSVFVLFSFLSMYLFFKVFYCIFVLSYPFYLFCSFLYFSSFLIFPLITLHYPSPISPLQLFDESLEIESVDDEAEASGDSSGASSW